jgi:hypothetical protein
MLTTYCTSRGCLAGASAALLALALACALAAAPAAAAEEDGVFCAQVQPQGLYELRATASCAEGQRLVYFGGSPAQCARDAPALRKAGSFAPSRAVWALNVTSQGFSTLSTVKRGCGAREYTLAADGAAPVLARAAGRWAVLRVPRPATRADCDVYTFAEAAGKGLALTRACTSRGASVALAPADGGAKQRWRLVRVGGAPSGPV